MIRVKECFCTSIMMLIAVDGDTEIHWCSQCGSLGIQSGKKMKQNIPSCSVHLKVNLEQKEK